tara:strand:+ start:442 stop:750 length:309 start_codon:yes stop_codon:yes gene_type:complete
MIPHKGTAVAELVGGQITQQADGTIVYNSGQTPPTEVEIDTKLKELLAEYDAQAYARNRKVEYDALNQLELMSDDSINGTTTHKDAIVAIKAKWPKDNSGPV